ncbi:PREDICTED: kelch-like protein 12 [Acropora digitifera]|uniref:kelch-like protein 12 n=1 Tax=Acropora digitifera TaxID=70779 RepID=UPI00077A0EE6|nr:PREDICTED: kelch-like protein 12 [Acropora digitifera]
MMETVSHSMSADPSQHHEELIERINALRTKQRFCDVTVVVKGEEFQAHKLVLAATSPFFLSLLESQMKERTEDVIKIELQEATAPVMEQVLAYVYTGNVSLTTENGHGLIATADYLLLPGLKTIAESFLKLHLTIENSVFNYYFAEKYQCSGLKEESCKMINENFRKVMETDDFLSLDENQAANWVSSDDVIVEAEQDIFEGILQWVLHNKSEREKNFPKLLQQVRLSSVSHEYLVDKLLNEELIKTNLDCVNFVMECVKMIFNCRAESGIKPARKCLERNENVIFVCGGSKALCYLPAENKWHELMNTTLEHKDHCIIQYRDRVYVFSPQKVGDNQSHLVEYYMPSTNSWGAIQTKFKYGGTFSSHKNITATTEVKKIIPAEATENGEVEFKEVAPMNEARHDAFGAAMNGKIYVAGGKQRDATLPIGERVLASCEVYDPSTDEWQVMPSLNVPRYSASMVCFKGALYVVGGLKNTARSKCGELSVEMFDSDVNEWHKKSDIPVPTRDQNRVKLKTNKETIRFNACFATVHKNCLQMVGVTVHNLYGIEALVVLNDNMDNG